MKKKAQGEEEDTGGILAHKRGRRKYKEKKKAKERKNGSKRGIRRYTREVLTHKRGRRADTCDAEKVR